jgi:hypothetical protein
MRLLFSARVEVNFLQADDIGFDLANYRRHPLGIAPAVRSNALMNIVGHRGQQDLPCLRP